MSDFVRQDAKRDLFRVKRQGRPLYTITDKNQRVINAAYAEQLFGVSRLFDDLIAGRPMRGAVRRRQVPFSEWASRMPAC